MSDLTAVAAVEAPAAVVDASVAEAVVEANGNGSPEANGETAVADAANGDAKDEGPTGKKGRGKKEKAVAPAAEPSRRSTRISSQPTKPKEEEPAPRKRSASGAKKNGKRGADEVEGEADEGSNKKVKSEDDGLKIGDSLPSISVKNEKGEEVNVANIATEKGVVFFCVPKADTPGCTTQACGYRDIYSEFTAVGYDVYCVSADTSEAQAKWQTKKTLPYSLLSDPSRQLIAALGAADKGNKTKRSHFVFEKGGKLVDKKMPVKPADSPKIALEFIKSHTGAGSAADVDTVANGAAQPATDADVVMTDATAAVAPEVAPAVPPTEAAAPLENAPVGGGVGA